MNTKFSGDRYCSGFSTTPLTTEKIALLAPTPSASVRTATDVNTGDLMSDRMV
jgi:hypothetical protein